LIRNKRKDKKELKACNNLSKTKKKQFKDEWNEQTDKSKLQMKQLLKIKILKKRRREKFSWYSIFMEFI